MVAGIDSEAAQGDILNPVGSGKIDLWEKQTGTPACREKGRGDGRLGAGLYTVNKLRSGNLLFSRMFCIERKIVHVGAEESINLYFKQVCADLENFNLTLIDAEDCTASEKWGKFLCF